MPGNRSATSPCQSTDGTHLTPMLGKRQRTFPSSSLPSQYSCHVSFRNTIRSAATSTAQHPQVARPVRYNGVTTGREKRIRRMFSSSVVKPWGMRVDEHLARFIVLSHRLIDVFSGAKLRKDMFLDDFVEQLFFSGACDADGHVVASAPGR